MALLRYWDEETQTYKILPQKILQVPYDISDEDISRFTTAILEAIPNGDEMEY